MRDPERIRPFLAKLEELWNLYPDFRFLQLVTVLSNTEVDPFYVEDDETLKSILYYLTKAHNGE